MKKVLAFMLVLCMFMAFVPVISFAESNVITSNLTAFFTPNGSLSTVEGSSESGSSSVLVAWNHSDNWNAANSFTDTDGTVTEQTVTSGLAFSTSRQAVVSFDIPENFDADKVAMVTLGLTVRYVKQIDQAGARLAVYGNSVDMAWTASTDKSVFGVSGSDSGTGNLHLLGLTTPINSAGNNLIDQEVTLSSLALTEYVKAMAADGKSQVTFRLAVPYGGVWIYNSTSAHPATLTIEEGSLSNVTVKTIYLDGDQEIGNESRQVKNLVVGNTYEESAPASNTIYNNEIYVYDETQSVMSVTVTADGKAQIKIIYTKYNDSNTFSGYEVDDEGAWCWFADPRSISYKNEDGTLDFSIIGYIDIHGSIKATQINHLTEEVNEVLIRTNIQPDDHNNPTFLVLPDERIIVFYSRHTDEACFWYRVTEEKGDLTTLGEEKCLNTSANTTYPSPFLMENDPDHIYLMWRGINWHPTIAKLSIPDEEGNTQFTYGPYQMVQSTAARPYAKYSSNGVDKLYVTYSLGHPDNEANNWVFFNQIDIATMTLENVKGETMTTIANGPLNVNASNSNQTHIVDNVYMRDWVWQVAAGEDGNPVIALVRINGGKTSHDYYYAKWNGTEWVKTFLANGGGHFHQTPGLEMCYSGGMAIDPDNTNIMYCSVPQEGVFGTVYEIIKYTMSDDGTEILETEQITKNSVKNNVRPFVIPNSEDKDIRLIWMYGDYTDWIVSNAHPTAYGTAVHAEAPLPAGEVDETDGIFAVEYYGEIGGSFISTKETANVLEAELHDDFTVSADIYLEGDYEGKLLDLGDIELSVKTMTTQYGAAQSGDRARVVVTVDDIDYVSSNVYGSSDCWTTYGRGTGGNYGVENYQGYVNHIFTYDGEYLTLYRDGLVDMKIKAEGLTLKNVEVGGFEGLADNIRVHDTVLNHDTIKYIVATVGEVEVPEAEGTEEIVKHFTDLKGNEIKESETITLNPGTDYYNFVPDQTIITDASVYELVNTDILDGEYYAYYDRVKDFTSNKVYNGDMSLTTTDGTYTYVAGWKGGYVNRVHNDLSDRPYLREANANGATYDAHFIYNAATDDEPASVTIPARGVMSNDGWADYPWKSDVSEPYMAFALTNWFRDSENPEEYLKAKEGRTYVMSFDIKVSEINPNSWVNNVVGFDAVTVNGDSYENALPGTNGDITGLTSVLDNHIGRAKYTTVADEWVTIEAMATANADGYFMFQIGWSHEWGETSIRNFSVREVVPAVKQKITASVNGTTLTVIEEEIPEGAVIVMSVNDSEVVESKVYDGVTPVTFTLPEGAEKVKVMAFKSLTSLEPWCKMVELTLN